MFSFLFPRDTPELVSPLGFCETGLDLLIDWKPHSRCAEDSESVLINRNQKAQGPFKEIGQTQAAWRLTWVPETEATGKKTAPPTHPQSSESMVP